MIISINIIQNFQSRFFNFISISIFNFLAHPEIYAYVDIVPTAHWLMYTSIWWYLRVLPVLPS